MAHLGLDLDRPAHGLGQAPADGQPEPGPAVGPRGRGILLQEGLEEPFHAVGRNARAAVGDGEAQSVLLALAAGHLQQHLTPVGELDRVAEEIDQDLTQTRHITDHDLGQSRCTR